MRHRAASNLTLLFFAAMLLSACSAQSGIGGVEAGNPPPPTTREVRGTVPSDDGVTTLRQNIHDTKQNLAPACRVDTVVATDSSGSAAAASDINADCTFALTLQTQTAYVIEFTRNDALVATLAFEMTSANEDAALFPSTFLFVSESASALDLGLIVFNGAIAYPSNDPTEQNDFDGDGIPDDLDDDDNNNATADSEEADCDLDGLPDFYDPDTSSCSPADAAAAILEVSPRNLAGLVGPLTAVSLTENVLARASCRVDANSLNASTFRVTNSSGQDMSCDYTLSNSGKTVICSHDLDPFALQAQYTATIENLLCDDGSPIESATWEWKTTSLL